MKPPSETYVVTLRPVAGWGNIPGIVRLRRLLKLALRSCGLRCVSVADAKPEAPSHAPPRRKNPPE
jgi:hypothetical protein